MTISLLAYLLGAAWTGIAIWRFRVTDERSEEKARDVHAELSLLSEKLEDLKSVADSAEAAHERLNKLESVVNVRNRLAG